MSNFVKLGPYITAIWLLLTGFIIYGKWDTSLSINAIGDYLAGMMSPLALFWLIIGFYLQREELKQNTEALNLQAEELKNLVEANKALVQQNTRSADLQELEINLLRQGEEPHLIPFNLSKGRGSGVQTTKIQFKNHGGDAINLNPVMQEVRSIHMQPNASGISRNEEGVISIVHDGPFVKTETVYLKYENKSGDSRKISFLLNEETTIDDLKLNFSSPHMFE